MVYEEEVEKQRRRKYQNHDLPIEDISIRDLDLIRDMAVRDLVETKEHDNVKVVISNFLGYLTSKGYRVTKVETK